MYRQDALRELLKIVFGVTTISVTNDSFITYQGKWFSNCSYDDRAYEKYCELFKLILLSDSPQIIDKNSDADTKFDKSEAISSIIQYFEMYNISIAEVYETFSDKSYFYKWLYEIFKENLLPVILISDSNKAELKITKENISKEFQESLKEIEMKIAQRHIRANMEPKAEIILYDLNYRKEECNLKINCLGLFPSDIMDRMLSLQPIMVLFYYPFCPKGNSVSYLDFFQESILAPNTKSYSFEETKAGYNKIRLWLSKKKIKQNSFYSENYIFLTYLDEKQILAYNCISPEDLNNIIRQKAKNRLRVEIQSRYIAYCQDVFEFVDDVLRRIFSLDFKKMVRFNDCKVEEIKEELQKVIVNFGQLYLILNDYDEECYRKQSYLIIQNIIFAAIKMLERQGEIFSKEFNEQIAGSEKLKNHKRRIKSYCSSDNLLKAIEIEKKMEKEHPCEYKNPVSIEDIYDYRIPGMIKKLKDAAEKYAGSLKAK